MSFLLKEDGDFLLQEIGDKLVLEQDSITGSCYLKHDKIRLISGHVYRFSFKVRSNHTQDIGVKIQDDAGSYVSLDDSFSIKKINTWKQTHFEFTALETNFDAQIRITPESLLQNIYFDNFKLIDLTLERKEYRIMRIQGSVLPGSFVQILTLREKTANETA